MWDLSLQHIQHINTSCCTQAQSMQSQLLCSLWDFSSLARIKPTSSAFQGVFLTTGPPGKSQTLYNDMFSINRFWVNNWKSTVSPFQGHLCTQHSYHLSSSPLTFCSPFLWLFPVPVIWTKSWSSFWIYLEWWYATGHGRAFSQPGDADVYVCSEVSTSWDLPRQFNLNDNISYSSSML